MLQIMHGLTPIAETVFTDAYWEPIVPLPSTESRSPVALGQHRDIERLCTEAAFNIFSTSSGNEIATAGTLLDYSSDNEFIQPGNVLLIDSERITSVGEHEDAESCDDDLPHFKSAYMEGEHELAVSARALFRRNSRRTNPLTGETIPPTVFPYKKILCNPAAQMHFTRHVQLVAVGHDRRGNVAAPEPVRVWNARNVTQEISGVFQIRKAFSDLSFPLPRVVGQAYDVGSEDNPEIFRIRSVELCHSGELRRAPAKRKLALPKFSFGGQTAPQPT